jgi:hypothetical protein
VARGIDDRGNAVDRAADGLARDAGHRDLRLRALADLGRLVLEQVRHDEDRGRSATTTGVAAASGATSWLATTFFSTTVPSRGDTTTKVSARPSPSASTRRAPSFSWARLAATSDCFRCCSAASSSFAGST